MNEKWIEYTKRADFSAWGQMLGVSPLTARMMKNRGIDTPEEAELYLRGTMEDLADPLLMKDMEKGAAFVSEAIARGERIAVSSDFDDDGIFAAEILREGIENCGGTVKIFTPDRVREGYGINKRIIDQAAADDCRLIVTCDNGIAAVKEIAYAVSLGIRVVVTDHHEVQEVLPPADAVIDPKQEGCAYPFKGLCGAGVAFRLVEVLYARFGVPKTRLSELYEYAAIATVADVMELQGENRIIVRYGLEKLRHTERIGLNALIEACALRKSRINAGNIGFVIGPSFNAVGRLGNVRLAFDLLECTDPERAMLLAEEVRALNEKRKELTENGVREAMELASSEEYREDRILLLRLHGVHESIVGIIAGRIKEAFGKPVFVFTDAENCLKGSGRSVKAYHMMNGLMECRDLPERFGGHAMAAGLSILEERLPELRRRLNENCTLTADELRPVVQIDARVPFSALSASLVRELETLEPFGTGNPSPVLAVLHTQIRRLSVVGKNKNVIKLTLTDGTVPGMDAVLFGDAEGFLSFLRERFGEGEVDRAMRGRQNNLDVAFCFAPEINEYNGYATLQIVCRYYCVIPHKSV